MFQQLRTLGKRAFEGKLGIFSMPAIAFPNACIGLVSSKGVLPQVLYELLSDYTAPNYSLRAGEDARQALENKDAERPPVHRMIVPEGADDFWCQIFWRADDCVCPAVHHFRQAEIHQLHEAD